MPNVVINKTAGGSALHVKRNSGEIPGAPCGDMTVLPLAIYKHSAYGVEVILKHDIKIALLVGQVDSIGAIVDLDTVQKIYDALVLELGW